MAEIIMEQLEEKFINLVKTSKEKIIISTQFIKIKELTRLLENVSSNIEMEILTSSKLSNFLMGASDIEALERLLKSGVKVKTLQNFNNKLYFFDKQVLLAPIDMNEFSFNNKNEFGILFNEEDMISKFQNYYKKMLRNNFSRTLTKYDVDTLKKCYKRLSRKCNYKYDLEGDIILLLSNIEVLTHQISAPWQERMLLYIHKNIKKSKFMLQDIYIGKEFFLTLYPNNKTIEARMRRTLQELRDYGLIKFYGKGNYKILWEIKK